MPAEPLRSNGLAWTARLQWIALGAIAVVGAIQLERAYASFAFEDAYITDRYARNVADGLGYVFTPGKRVFGATAPLQTLLLALFHRLGADIHWSAGVLYAVSLGAVAWIGGTILRELGAPNAGILFALAVVAGTTPIAQFWGLETPLLTDWILGSFLALLRGRDLLASVLVALAFLTRDDAAMFALLGHAWLRTDRTGQVWIGLG